VEWAAREVAGLGMSGDSVLGADGELAASVGPFPRNLDWAQVLRTLESGGEEEIRRMLPRVTWHCAAAQSGGGGVPSKRCAERLLELLEGGTLSKYFQEWGALGSFVSVLNYCACRPQYWDVDSKKKRREHEQWRGELGWRVMRWLRPKMDRLAAQPLMAAITALQETFNATWTLKQCALLKVEYLEFGYALFEQLQEWSASTLMDRLNPLWGAAVDYMMSILKLPTVPESGPFRPDECAPDMVPLMALIQETCLKLGMLEWAVSRAKILLRKPGQHEVLLTRILLMATNLEVGQIRFAAIDSAMEVVVDYLEDAAKGVYLHNETGVKAPVDPSPRVAVAYDLTSCITRLMWLPLICSFLVGDGSAVRANKAWREFCVAGRVGALKLVLGGAEVIRRTAQEELNPKYRRGNAKRLAAAEALWEKAAAEFGLKRCSNPVGV
jgi:hypothetical protein